MELEEIKKLIKEEVSNQIHLSFCDKISLMDVDSNEFLIVKLQGPFNAAQYHQLEQILHERFGDRALVMGSDKNYNIEITKGKIKNG